MNGWPRGRVRRKRQVGLCPPAAKFAMSCMEAGAFAVTELRIVGAAALFEISPSRKPGV